MAAEASIIDRVSPRNRLFVALVSTGVISYFVVGSLLNRVLGDTTYSQLSLFNEVVRLVIDSYVEPINVDRALGHAHRGLVEALDGDSAYLTPAVLAAEKDTERPDADIGVLLSRRYSFLMIASVRAGSSADEAGLRAGDVIKTIDGRHTRPLSAVHGRQLLEGAPGSMVTLEVLRSGSDPIEFRAERERRQRRPVSSRILEPGIGYLKIEEFTATTSDETRTEIEVLRRSGAEQLVLDLRGAATGEPELGAGVAGLFIEAGVVAKRSGRSTEERVWEADAVEVAWSDPLTTLVNLGTSGPGEVAAAALLDAERSELIGEPTFGRAPFQKMLPLPEGGLLLTVAKYLRRNGDPIHGAGLQPTLVVAEHHHEADEDPIDSEDPILEAALERLRAPEKKAA